MNLREINIWKEKPADPSNNQVLQNVNILELGLGQRAYNGLKRAGCNTVGDVMAIIGEDGSGIRNVRNLGDKSVKEIMEKLEVLSENYQSVSAASYQSDKKKVLLKPNGNTWNRDISSLGLSDTALKQLKKAGISRVGDIYSPGLRQDPGWIAIRELFDRIINEAV